MKGKESLNCHVTWKCALHPKARARAGQNASNMPTVDIIIPAYNAARYLATALDSVVAQTYTDWRILLVDDGSTDNTPEILAPYREQLGDKLQYIPQPNGGLPAARNRALRESTAEFLALLDADDVWLPDRLEKTMLRFRERPQAGLAYGFVITIDPAGRQLETFATRAPVSEGFLAPQIYMRLIDLPCPSITFRRTCIDTVGFFDENLKATEDRDLCLRIALRFEVILVPHIIAFYRTSPASMSTDPERMLRAQLQFVEKHFGAPGCGRLQRRIALSRIYKQRAEALAGRNLAWAALKSSLRALAFYPGDTRNLRTALSLFVRYLRSPRSRSAFA